MVAITHHSIKLHEAALVFSAGLDGNYPRSSPKFYPIAVQLVWEWTYDQGMNWWRCDLKVNIHHWRYQGFGKKERAPKQKGREQANLCCVFQSFEGQIDVLCVLRFKVSDFPLSNCLWEKLSALRGLVETCLSSKILSLGTGFKDIMLSPWSFGLGLKPPARIYLTVGTIFNLASNCHQKIRVPAFCFHSFAEWLVHSPWFFELSGVFLSP